MKIIFTYVYLNILIVEWIDDRYVHDGRIWEDQTLQVQLNPEIIRKYVQKEKLKLGY